MSLRTRMIASVSIVMLLICGFLTVNLLVDAVVRREAHRLDKADFLSRLVADWIRNDVQDLRSAQNWADVKRGLASSALAKTWIIAGRRPDSDDLVIMAAGGEESELGADEKRILRSVFEGRKTEIRENRVYTPIVTGWGEFAGRFDLKVEPPELDLTRNLGGIVVIMLLGTLILVCFTYLLIDRMVLRPLGSILDASRRIAEGNYSRRIPEPRRQDEMATMIRAFNSMMEKVEAYHQTLREDIRKARERITHTERKLFHAQRLSTTGTLAAGIAHEINNPLGGMINAAGALKSGALKPAKQAEYLDLIADGLNRIRAIVQKILHFRPAAVPPVPLSLKEIVDRAIAFLEHKARSKGVDVRNGLAADLPSVHGDALELQQAFLNVLMNAVDACSPQAGKVSVTHRIEGGRVRVLVEDNGAGMEAEELERCQDPFFTTKDQGEGTGLGLPVAKAIVENHGGSVALRSQKGRGTVVEFEFPLAGNAASARSG
ncbi:MAG: HAMP domain-containing histidine kinase [Planctomycetes bacterium]|nr:HAMP domain-containing histidine kinase [Planctomycetota bacterium]